MTKKIDIAEILKDKPANTKLYSPLFGEVYFSHVGSGNIAVEHHGGISLFFSSGRFFNYDESEPLLFPSKEMRDWRKFAWKKGDVLVSNDGKIEVIFEKFGSDTYQSFIGKHHLDSLDENLYYQDEGAYPTASFNIETEDAAQTYINTIEERLDGKLNHETLEIEKTLPEFKDGDIVSLEIRYIDSENVIVETYIVYGAYNYEEYLNFYAGGNNICMINHNSCVKSTNNSVRNVFIRYATDSEKQKLFDTLAKNGKAWDAEKKQIVDLPKKCELNPFDRVLVRDNSKQKWIPDMYRFYDKDEEFPYNCFSSTYKRCIPYNEDTKHLLGTTDEWKGGEG